MKLKELTFAASFSLKYRAEVANVLSILAMTVINGARCKTDLFVVVAFSFVVETPYSCGALGNYRICYMRSLNVRRHERRSFFTVIFDLAAAF